MEDGYTFVEIARSCNYPPYLLGKMVLEQVLGGYGGGNANTNKKKAGDAMKDPRRLLRYFGKEGDGVIVRLGGRKKRWDRYLVEKKEVGNGVVVRRDAFTNRIVEDCYSNGSSEFPENDINFCSLANDILECIQLDPINGPRHDKYRRSLGIEYELLLVKNLRTLHIPFETEDSLRLKGAAKTPDILLLSPIGVYLNGSWRVVCWIDSKALFGDENTHKSEVLPQAESYVHRYGPGLILYWFGHAPNELLWEGVGGEGGDIAVCGFGLPAVRMFPNGVSYID